MPPRRTRSVSRAARIAALEALLLGEDTRPQEPQLDLCLVALGPSDEVLYAVGGVWDRGEDRFVTGPEGAERCHLLRFTAAQLPAARHFAAWLQAFDRGEVRDRVLFLGGRRRGGKTDAALKFAWSLAIKRPGSRILLASQAIDRRGEIDDAIRGKGKLGIPTAWYDYVGDPEYCYRLANGSEVRNTSGGVAAKLKRGEALCVVLNEAQEHTPKSAAFALPATIDSGGLTILAANPPLPGSRGEWTIRLRKQFKRGKLRGTFFDVDPGLNPHIDAVARADVNAIVTEIDPRIGKADADGEWLDPTERAYPQWTDAYIVERSTLGLRDITREVTRRRWGYERDAVVGLDPQGKPHYPAVRWIAMTGRLAFTDDDGQEQIAEGTSENPLYLVDDVLVLDKADDAMMLDELDAIGWLTSSVFVCDPTSQWQGAKHEFEREAPTFKAFKARAAGVVIVPPMRKRSDKGLYAGAVKVADRLDLARRLMRWPRVFLRGQRAGKEIEGASEGLRWLARSFAGCELAPSVRASTRVPRGRMAHVTDAATYALIGLEGERWIKARASSGYESGSLGPVAGRPGGPRIL